MPSQAAHTQAAIENRKALDYLAERVDDFPQWVVTVAFYTALQVVEAIFAHDGQSTDEHSARNRKLKESRRYQQIWKHYRHLWNDSLIARYLATDQSTTDYARFADYLSPADVLSQHVNHHLQQIILSARRLLNDPDFMQNDH